MLESGLAPDFITADGGGQVEPRETRSCPDIGDGQCSTTALPRIPYDGLRRHRHPRAQEKPSNWVLQHHMVTHLKRRVRQGVPSLDGFVDRKAFSRVRTFRQFDEVYTAPLAGYRDALDYYEKASALPHLKNIQLPTLLIHSLDDPVIPAEPLQAPEVHSNPSLEVVLTQRGGHVGFMEKERQGDPDRFWAENRVIDFFRLFVSRDNA